MKEWEELEELEEKFLTEIKPLVDQFIKIRKQELNLESRMECVDIRKKAQIKVDEFIRICREKLSKLNIEIEKREIQIEQMKKERKKQLETMIAVRNKIIEIDGELKETHNEEEYQGLCLSEIKEKQKYDKIRQEYDIKLKEYKFKIEKIDELKKIKTDFEEKYGDMSHITEREMYSLYEFIGLKEVRKTSRMSDSQAYDENGNVLDMENIMDMQQRAEEKRKNEVQEIQKEIAKQVLDEKKKEYNEYLKQKMKELEENIDKELREMEEEKERGVNIHREKESKDIPKQGRIRRLWKKITSIFRKKEVPRLEEGKGQEVKPENKFTYLKTGAPTQKQQKENAKSILNINAKSDKTKERDFKDGITILD